MLVQVRVARLWAKLWVGAAAKTTGDENGAGL